MAQKLFNSLSDLTLYSCFHTESQWFLKYGTFAYRFEIPFGIVLLGNWPYRVIYVKVWTAGYFE